MILFCLDAHYICQQWMNYFSFFFKKCYFKFFKHITSCSCHKECCFPLCTYLCCACAGVDLALLKGENEQFQRRNSPCVLFPESVSMNLAQLWNCQNSWQLHLCCSCPWEHRVKQGVNLTENTREPADGSEPKMEMEAFRLKTFDSCQCMGAYSKCKYSIQVSYWD